MGVCYSRYIIPVDNTLRPEPARIVALVDAWLAAGFVPVPGTASSTLGPGDAARESGASFILDEWRKEERIVTHARPWWQRLIGWPKPFPRRLSPAKPFAIPIRGASFEALSSSGVSIEWPINNYTKVGTIYPLERVPDLAPYGDYGPSYKLRIIAVDDFVNEETDRIDGGCKQLDTRCVCGHELSYVAPFDQVQIHRVCTACGTSFRPQDQLVEVTDGSSGRKYTVPGGVCYRFAIVVDCGKDYPFGPAEDVRGEDGNNESRSVAIESDVKASSKFLDCSSSALGIELRDIGIYD